MLKTITVLFVLLPYIIIAQNNKGGVLEIIQDERIGELVDKHIAINKIVKKNGYRIQIYFDSGNNSKSRAYEVKHSFTLNYPDVDVYILFEAPYYKVRVGNFRTRLDAYSFFRKISAKYPDAFIVKDFIDYP